MDFKSRASAGALLTLAIALVTAVVLNGQANRKEPLQNLQFGLKVEIEGFEAATGFFRSVSGLKAETEVVDYQEGGVTGFTRKLAGATRYSNIRLSRAFTGDRSLYNWFASVQKPNPIRVNGRITMFDRQGVRVAAWKFTNAFPVKWEGPDFDATKNEIAIETIEIAHEGMTFTDDEN